MQGGSNLCAVLTTLCAFLCCRQQRLCLCNCLLQNARCQFLTRFQYAQEASIDAGVVVYPSDVQHNIGTFGFEHELGLHPGIGRVVKCTQLCVGTRLRIRGIETAVLRVGIHSRSPTLSPDGEQVSLSFFYCPAFLDGGRTATASTTFGQQISTSVCTTFRNYLEVVLRKFLVATRCPVGKPIVERGVGNQILTSHDKDTIGCFNLVTQLWHYVLCSKAIGHEHAHEHEAQRKELINRFHRCYDNFVLIFASVVVCCRFRSAEVPNPHSELV